jgi:hypothetical protein
VCVCVCVCVCVRACGCYDDDRDGVANSSYDEQHRQFITCSNHAPFMILAAVAEQAQSNSCHEHAAERVARAIQLNATAPFSVICPHLSPRCSLSSPEHPFQNNVSDTCFCFRNMSVLPQLLRCQCMHDQPVENDKLHHLAVFKMHLNRIGPSSTPPNLTSKYEHRLLHYQ